MYSRDIHRFCTECLKSDLNSVTKSGVDFKLVRVITRGLDERRSWCGAGRMLNGVHLLGELGSAGVGGRGLGEDEFALVEFALEAYAEGVDDEGVAVVELVFAELVFISA